MRRWARRSRRTCSSYVTGLSMAAFIKTSSCLVRSAALAAATAAAVLPPCLQRAARPSLPTASCTTGTPPGLVLVPSCLLPSPPPRPRFPPGFFLSAVGSFFVAAKRADEEPPPPPLSLSLRLEYAENIPSSCRDKKGELRTVCGFPLPR